MSIINITFLTGHTASGKTDLVFSLFEDLTLTKKQKTFVINSDAYQIYKELILISTQPDFKEFLEKNQKIKEKFLTEIELKKYFLLYDYLDFSKKFSVFDMINLIRQNIIYCIDIECTKNIIITGGSPMYMRLLIDGMQRQNTQNPLDKIDNFEDFLQKNFQNKRFNIKKNILYKKRDILYKNCENRFDNLIQKGVLNEVSLYLEKIKTFADYTSFTSYKTLGIKEIESYFEKRIDFQEMLSKIKQKTRKYIKHQDTWFRNKFKDFEFLS